MDGDTARMLTGIWTIAIGVVLVVIGFSARAFYGVTGLIGKTTSKEVDATLGRTMMCVGGFAAIAAGTFFAFFR